MVLLCFVIADAAEGCPDLPLMKMMMAMVTMVMVVILLMEHYY